MKKQLLLIGLIFTMFVAFAQTTETKSETQPTATADSIAEPQNDFCPHRILFRFGGGYANYTFKKIPPFSKQISYSAMAEIGYAFFFHRNVGIGIGVGINHAGIIKRVNDNTSITVKDDNYNAGASYDMTYTANKLKQKQTVWAIEVPLTLQFEKKWGHHGIYAGVGLKGYFPFATRIGYTDGVIEIPEIYDPVLNVKYTDLEIHMADQNVKGHSVKPKLRCSLDVLAEFGGVFGISRSTDIYLGLYASYSVLNIYPKDGITLDNIKVDDIRLPQVFDQYVNHTDKWNAFQVGLKLGFHFLTCRSNRDDEYMSDLKRRYMNKMIQKKDEPIIITNTVQEYYYFVPTISQELLDEAANNPEKKKAILELADKLSKTKILFDLDKDIPKLDDVNKEHIKNAADLLKANPDFKVMVTGYTSPEGTREHNQGLGNRRAIAVRKLFIDHGVPGDQISTQNFTADDPQHKEDIPDKDYKQQRAVIFKIEKK